MGSGPENRMKRGLSGSQPETPSAASKRARPAGHHGASNPQGQHPASQPPPQPEAQPPQSTQHKPEKTEGILHERPEEDSEENGVSAPQEAFGLAPAHSYPGLGKGGKEREREREGEEPREETREHNWRTGQKYFDEEEHVAQIMVKVERQREKFTDFQRKIFETTEAAITQLAEEREQMEQTAFSLYGQKMQEITATLERIGKLETTLASFLGTIENIYQSVFPEAD